MFDVGRSTLNVRQFSLSPAKFARSLATVSIHFVPPWFAIDNPRFLVAALLIAAAAVTLALLYRINLPRGARLLASVGLLLLSLAAGGLAFHQRDPREILVMIDLSPSTRTALYRNPADLHRRIDQLLGDLPRRILYFSQSNHTDNSGASPLPDLPAERTIFAPPPDAPAILLFTDAQFEPPTSAPPVYIAADPLLENPADASIDRLEIRGDTLASTVNNSTSSALPLSSPTTRPIAPGRFVVTSPLPQTTGPLTARIDSTDPWPENNRLSILPAPPMASERWWLGLSAPAGWRTLSALPSDPESYLAPAVITLNNLPGSSFSSQDFARLEQYVADLGGALLILGGDRAFAAGGYPGTTLDALSPLAGSPPTPTIHWVLLLDSSGSMAQPVGDKTRWDLARAAMLGIIPHLPPNDPISIGSFSDTLRWWSQGKAAKETTTIAPPNISVGGATNLQSALVRLIDSAQGNLPHEVLLLTDAEARIDNAATIRQGLLDKRIRLHVLAIGSQRGRAMDILEQLVSSTGGTVVSEGNAANWSAAAQRLFQQASPDHLLTTPTTIRYLGPLASRSPRQIELWNRTWLKDQATLLAQADAAQNPPLAARWNVGSGEVLSAAFSPNQSEVAAMATLIARPPRDPRFAVTWQTGPTLRITIDAADGNRYLNNLPIRLQLGTEPHPVPQTAPGRYELELDAPRNPVIAILASNTQVLDRFPIPGRYPKEFDAIGNNRAHMQALADRTGGAVIPPADQRPIQFNLPRRRIPLTPWLALAGAAALGLALIQWRRS